MPLSDKKMQKKPMLIWDLSLRIFHWLLVILFIGAIVTAKNGFIEQHAIIGILLAGLLFFRILWGFFGSETARFTYFIKTPRHIIAYLRGKENRIIGHNPLGALMVLAFILLLPTQIILGLFSNDDILFEAPLAYLISSELSDNMAFWHHQLSHLLIIMVIIHIIAILWYLVKKRENLTLTMISGWKYVSQIPAALPLFVPLWRAFVIAFLAFGLVFYLLSL